MGNKQCLGVRAYAVRLGATTTRKKSLKLNFPKACTGWEQWHLPRKCTPKVCNPRVVGDVLKNRAVDLARARWPKNGFKQMKCILDMCGIWFCSLTTTRQHYKINNNKITVVLMSVHPSLTPGKL